MSVFGYQPIAEVHDSVCVRLVEVERPPLSVGSEAIAVVERPDPRPVSAPDHDNAYVASAKFHLSLLIDEVDNGGNECENDGSHHCLGSHLLAHSNVLPLDGWCMTSWWIAARVAASMRSRNDLPTRSNLWALFCFAISSAVRLTLARLVFISYFSGCEYRSEPSP